MLTAPAQLQAIAELVYSDLSPEAPGQLRRLQALPSYLEAVFTAISQVSVTAYFLGCPILAFKNACATPVARVQFLRVCWRSTV